jgi:hypothetical protein
MNIKIKYYLTNNFFLFNYKLTKFNKLIFVFNFFENIGYSRKKFTVMYYKCI